MVEKHSMLATPALECEGETDASPEWSGAAAKWGDALSMGFAIIPGVLIRAQAKLELDALDLAILLNLILHWWTPKDWPYPPPRILANRIGVSIRTIERRLESLEQRGFLIRHPSEKSPEGLARRRIELTPLVVRLQAFARAGLAMRQQFAANVAGAGK